MTPRFRTAFSVPSGFAASAPASQPSTAMPASQMRQAGPVARASAKPTRAEQAPERASAAA